MIYRVVPNFENIAKVDEKAVEEVSQHEWLVQAESMADAINMCKARFNTEPVFIEVTNFALV